MGRKEKKASGAKIKTDILPDVDPAKIKKPRVCFDSLDKYEPERRLFVGELKSIAHQMPIRQKEMKEVFIDAMAVEFKLGRQFKSSSSMSSTPSETSRKNVFGFVVIADCTGTISIGANIGRSGLEKFQLDPDNITESSRCYFETKLIGDIIISPKNTDPETPIISLRGEFNAMANVNLSPFQKFARLMYPTSDVLEQVCHSPYADVSRYTTTAVIGRIESIKMRYTENRANLSVEDPVGSMIIDITNIEEPESFVHKKGLARSSAVIVCGELKISETRVKVTNGSLVSYACVKINYNDPKFNVVNISNEEFFEYGRILMDVPRNFFSGVIPENLSGT